MDYALTAYPLSSGFRARFEKAVGASPTYLRVPELRRMSLPAMVRALRAISGERLFIPLEDAGCSAILPVLTGMASLTRAREIEVVDHQLRREPFSRWSLPKAALSFGAASIAGLVQLGRCRKSLARLMAAPRRPATFGPGQDVLYVNANMWFGLKAGGSIGHVAGVVNSLQRRGRHVVYAAAEPAVMADAEVEHFPIAAPAQWGLPYESNRYRFHASSVAQLSSLARRRMFQFIYQRMSVSNYAGVELSRRMEVPLVLEYNGSETWVQQNWGMPLRYGALATAAEEACLRHAHLVVTVSDVLRDELVERGVERQRVVSYPNGIDTRTFDPEKFSPVDVRNVRARYGVDMQDKVVMFLGTFGQWHGVEVLARAINKLAAERADWLARHRVRFLLVGDGVGMPAVREILSVEACRSWYVLCGLVPQAEAALHLAAADVLVSPHVPNSDGSRFFGSPTKLFEYMAMGKAIAASNLEQIGEVLSPGLSIDRLPQGEPAARCEHPAVLTAPGSEDELIAAVQFLVERPRWREELGSAARRKALACYTWDRHVDAILTALNDITPADDASPVESHQRQAA